MCMGSKCYKKGSEHSSIPNKKLFVENKPLRTCLTSEKVMFIGNVHHLLNLFKP